MLRICLYLVAVVFGVAVVVVSALSVGKQGMVVEVGAKDLVAQGDIVEVDIDEASESGEVMMISESFGPESRETVDYYSPYPGLLPDHPLYFVKMLRDRIKIMFAGSGEDKGVELLLCADKRIGAAYVLIEGGKSGLGVETGLKAEQYLSRAVEQFEASGIDEYKEKLARAALKHAELLEGIESRVGGDELIMIEEARAINNQIVEKLSEGGE